MAKMSRRRSCARIRGRQIAMVYQDPMSSLNPVIPIGKQLMEVPIIHFGDERGGGARPRAADAARGQPARPARP